MVADWASDAEIGNLGSAYVMNNGSHIFLAGNRRAYLVDGRSGQTIQTFDDSFWERVAGNINFEVINPIHSFSGNTGEMISDAYTLYPLQGTGVMLLLDYRFRDEIMMAVDMTSGRELWKQTDLSYSLGNYQGLVESAGANVGRRLASMLGAEHEEESAEEKRDRQVRFMERVLFHPEGKDYFFLKTFGGLLKIDAATGDIIFQQDGFDGSGIIDVKYLENGDYLVLSGGRNIADLAGSNAYHVARLSRNGDIVWVSEHSGRRTAGLFVADHTVLVDGYPTEAFDLGNGEKLWENDNRRGNDYHHTIIDGDAVYFASDLHGTTTRISESRAFKQDLRTGEIIWQTDTERNSSFTGATLQDGVLLTWGSGRAFEGNRDGIIAYDAETGNRLWRTSEMRSLSPEVIVDGNRVLFSGSGGFYAADLHTGEIILHTESTDQNPIESGLGAMAYNESFISIGRNGVTALRKSDGEVIYHSAVSDGATHYKLNGTKLAMIRNSRNAQVVDLDSGQISPVVRRNTGNRYYGHFDGDIFISEDASFAITLGRSGKLMRHRF